MAFINPFFLAAAAAVAGPLLLHLLLRNRPKRQMLPTLRFLPTTSQQSMSMHRFKNILLLALRSLIVLLIVIAFARPFIEKPESDETGDPAAAETGVVFAVDMSLSMRANGRWRNAVSRVRTYAKTLPTGTPMALVLFDQTPRIACAPTDVFGDIDQAVARNEAGYGATDILAAIRTAADLAAQLQAERRKVFLVSDFQVTGMKQLVPNLALPSGVELLTSPIDDEDLWNAVVLSATEVDDDSADRRRARVQIVAYGEGERNGKLVILQGDKRLAERDITLGANGGRIEEVELPLDPRREYALNVSLEIEDALTEDNSLAVVLESRGPLPLIVCSPPRGGTNPYLTAAIAAFGNKVNASWTNPDGLRALSTVDHPVAIVEAPEFYPASGWEALRTYARGGGSLVLFPCDQAEATELGFAASTPANTYRELCGVDVEGWAELNRRSGEYHLVNSHSAQGALSAIDQAGGTLLGYPKVYRYRNVRVPDDSGRTRALMRFDDGNPFLVEHQLGDGSVYFFTIPLETKSSDLVLRAAFSPFLYQLLDHCVRGGLTKNAYTVGEYFPAQPQQSSVKSELIAPDETSIQLTAQPAALAAPGIYRVRQGVAERSIAVHIDPEESDLTALPAARIETLSHSEGTKALRALDAESLSKAPPDPDAAGSLWWYLLAAALSLMAVESLVASRTSR
jgi:hypothetical protein